MAELLRLVAQPHPNAKNCEPCEGCPLAGPRVGSRGNPFAEIVLLGESPGARELISGLPFWGPSGELLEQAVPELDLERDTFMINALQCYPGKADAKDKSKVSLAVDVCRDRVLRQIAIAPRKVIFAMGNPACESILNTSGFKITQHRGEIHSVEIEGVAIPVVLSVHPAYLLRGSGSPNQFRADFRKAIEIARLPEGKTYQRRAIEPKPYVCSTPSEIYHIVMPALLSCGVVAADTETTGLDVFNDTFQCLGLYPTPRINLDTLLPYSPSLGSDTTYIIPDTLLENPQARWYLRRIFEESRARLRFIWHNGKFDVRFWWRMGFQPRIDEDTLLASWVLESGGMKDIEELARNELDAEDYKDEVKQYVPKKTDSWAKVPRPVLYRRLAIDCSNTAGVWHELIPRVLRDPHLTKFYYGTALPVSPLLAKIEDRGIAVDLDIVAQNETRLENETAVAEERFFDEAEKVIGMRPLGNLASFKDVSYILWDLCKIQYKNKRPPSTRKEILDKLVDNYPVVKALRQYRIAAKAHSTYVKPIYHHIKTAPDKRVHTTFLQHRTPTSRLASRAPNVQNIPRLPILRGMYRAGPGKVLLEGDYNTAELRELAAESADEYLTGIFLDDKRSLHDEVSVEMYGPNFTPDQRIRAKAINFGIPYGREAFSVAEEFDITVEEAQRLIDAWLIRFPGVAKLLRRCETAVARSEVLINVFGLKKRPGIVSFETIHSRINEFKNFLPQSTINGFTLHSALEIEPFLVKEQLGGLVNLVHDSIVAEIWDDPRSIYWAAKFMKYTMETVPTRWLKTDIIFKVDFKLGTHWTLGMKSYKPIYRDFEAESYYGV